jgi:RND family efflux transporter MFP subunit
VQMKPTLLEPTAKNCTLLRLKHLAPKAHSLNASFASAALLFLLVTTFGFLSGCSKGEPAAAEAPQAMPVKTVIAQNVPIPDSSEYLATLKSRHSTTVNPQVEGYVTQIFVKSGDQVSPGKSLMQIDPLKQQATVGSQEAARAAQVANVAYAKQQLDRARKLFDEGIVARQDLDQAQATYDAAEKQLQSLGSQLQEQQVELKYYNVVSPTPGIVGDIPVRVGDRVTVSTLLTTVDQPGSLEAYISVPVEKESSLKLGIPVELLDSDGNVIDQTHINFVSPQADPSTQSVLVKAPVQNAKDILRTSQFTRARLIWGTHPGPVIPILAVSRINGQYFAYLAEKNGAQTVARQKMLKVGEIVGNNYAVLDGIKPGDHVIVEGTQFLADGVPVSEGSPTASSAPAAGASQQ